MIHRMLTLWLLVIFLAACGGGGSGGGGDINPLTDERPGDDPSAVIQWNTDRSAIVFRADVTGTGAEDDPFARAGVPDCTIYGDGTVVWRVPAEDPLNSVLFGPVDAPRIRAFVSTITLEDFYSYDQQADLQIMEISPTVETLTLEINDVRHVTDAFGGWDRNYYDRLLDLCRTISPRPQIFRPDGLWVRVVEQEYDTNAPSVLWDADVTGVDLVAIADSGEPLWVQDRIAHLLWTYSRRAAPDLQYDQDERTFIVTIEIPNVSRFSPPAP